MLSSEKLQCTVCEKVEFCADALTTEALSCTDSVTRIPGDVDTSGLVKRYPRMYKLSAEQLAEPHTGGREF